MLGSVLKDSTPSDTDYYQVRVQGLLDVSWSEWLGGLEITWEAQGTSVLSGVLPTKRRSTGCWLACATSGCRCSRCSVSPATPQWTQ